MSSKDDFREALKSGNLADAFLQAMGDAIELNIVTWVSPADEDPKAGYESSRPGHRMRTTINLVQGDIENEIGDQFLTTGPYSELQKFHLEQVAQGNEIIRNNLQSLQKLFGFLSNLRKPQPQGEDENAFVDVESRSLPTESSHAISPSDDYSLPASDSSSDFIETWEPSTPVTEHQSVGDWETASLETPTTENSWEETSSPSEDTLVSENSWGETSSPSEDTSLTDDSWEEPINEQTFLEKSSATSESIPEEVIADNDWTVDNIPAESSNNLEDNNWSGVDRTTDLNTIEPEDWSDPSSALEITTESESPLPDLNNWVDSPETPSEDTITAVNPSDFDVMGDSPEAPIPSQETPSDDLFSFTQVEVNTDSQWDEQGNWVDQPSESSWNQESIDSLAVFHDPNEEQPPTTGDDWGEFADFDPQQVSQEVNIPQSTETPLPDDPIDWDNENPFHNF